MKILHVIPSYEPAWAFGGTVTATRHLCRALAKKGVDITVFTTNADGKGDHLAVPLSEPTDLGGVKVWYFNCDFGAREAFYSSGLSHKLTESVNNFDLVHVSAIWQWIQVDVYKTCKYFSKPYVVTTHGSFSTWAWNQNKMRKRPYWYLFGKKTIKSATALHFTAENERLSSFFSLPFLNSISSFIVPNGIELRNMNKSENIRTKLGIPEDKYILLYIGRIHRKKGIHLILEALKKIEDERFFLLVAGFKEDADYFNYLTHLSSGLKSEVFWHKSIPGNAVWDFYYSSDLFVLPSYDENFGMVVLEAMACGLPVLISKNVGIWREVKADGAGLVINQDADEIATILKKLCENTDAFSQMSQNARKSAKNRYHIDKVASLMIKAYEDILTGRRSPELQWK